MIGMKWATRSPFYTPAPRSKRFRSLPVYDRMGHPWNLCNLISKFSVSFSACFAELMALPKYRVNLRGLVPLIPTSR